MFLELSLWFTAAAALTLAAALLVRRIPLRRVAGQLGAALAIMVVLTAIFDNLMIYAGLFDYGQHTLTGVRIGMAPIEDFFYPVCAVLFVSGLWWLLSAAPRDQDTRPEPTARSAR